MMMLVRNGRRPRPTRKLEAIQRCRSGRLLHLGAALLLASGLAQASTISLGVVSFNTLIPSGPSSPGVNDFAIDNFTGSSSLPPDFPATTSLTFMNSFLLLTQQGGSQQTVSLGDLGPGSYTPASLQFSVVTNFTSAVFTATLNPTTFLISGGSSFQAANSQISVRISPSSGAVLVADTDFAPINVSNTGAAPEPGTAMFVLSAFTAAILLRKRYRSPN